jgi:hypothetical protein
MALAKANNEPRRKRGADEPSGDAHLGTSASREGSEGRPQPSERQGEGIRDYGRQGGSIADTGTRTDVPVGIEQAESSALSAPDSERARERQGYPPPPGDPADRGKVRPT